MGTYLADHGFKEGHAVWRFRLPNQVIYRNANHHALKQYWKMREESPFTVHVRTKEGWQFVVNHVPNDTCQCGRAYDSTPSGEPFRFQEYPLTYSIESLSNLMRSPVLCMVCYYKIELREGRWAPKYVKQQLGLET